MRGPDALRETLELLAAFRLHGKDRAAYQMRTIAKKALALHPLKCSRCGGNLTRHPDGQCTVYSCPSHDCHEFGRAQWVIAVDPAAPGGDRTVEVTMRKNEDGTTEITDVTETPPE